MDFRKDNQKYNNGRQLHIEDYLHENKLETKGNVEVPSTFVVPSKEEIGTKTVTNELLERILSKDNMNLAFKRVKEKSQDEYNFKMEYLKDKYYQAIKENIT